MSTVEKEPESKSENASGVDVELEVSVSKINKPEAMDVSEKSDALNTSGTSTDKKVIKKKRIKSSSSNQSHKKVKKDPNKPEYPKVGKENLLPLAMHNAYFWFDSLDFRCFRKMVDFILKKNFFFE